MGLGRLWTETGPTDEAISILRANGSPLSSGERTMLLVAFALWHGNQSLAFVELLGLDDDRLRLVASLLLALAGSPKLNGVPERSRSDIDHWVTRYQPEP